MIGEGVLLQVLDHPRVTHVLMVNRRASPMRHPKLSELIVADFTDLSSHRAQLAGYDTCIYCAGISSFGMSEAEYMSITYHTTILFADGIAALNPELRFFYLSGVYADSSETGRIMWARIKGKTENALHRIPMGAVYSFRPGFIKRLRSQKNVRWKYKILGRFYPSLFPKRTLSYAEIVSAIVFIAEAGHDEHTLEIKDLKMLAGMA